MSSDCVSTTRLCRFPALVYAGPVELVRGFQDAQVTVLQQSHTPCHHSYSQQGGADVEESRRDPRAAVTIRPVTAGVAELIDGAQVPDGVHLAAVGQFQAASGRQDALVGVASIRLETQVIIRAVGLDERKLSLSFPLPGHEKTEEAA